MPTEIFADNHICNDDKCNNINCIIPRQFIDLKEMVNTMDLKLFYISSGSTGHTFQACRIRRNENGKKVKTVNGDTMYYKDMAFAFKITAYPKKFYGQADDINRPENVELRMIKLLSGMIFKKQVPHLIIPLLTFTTTIHEFLNAETAKINIKDDKNELYSDFIRHYQEGRLENHVSVLVTEWANGGDLLNYIYDNYKIMDELKWKVIIFQVIFALAKFHLKYPNFRHNDLKCNNILIHLLPDFESKEFRYGYRDGENSKFRYCFVVPDIGMQMKICDFDFSCNGELIVNSKVESKWAREAVKITSRKNHYYDLHYFINSISDERCFRNFKKYVPITIVDFIKRTVPDKFSINTKNTNFITENGRLAVHEEYTTPSDILMYDSLFTDFRYIETD